MSTPIEMGLLFTGLIGAAGFARVLWPMRVFGEPPKLMAGANIYRVYTYTGRVAAASKAVHTTFGAQSTVNQNPVTGDLSHALSTSQTTTVQDDITLLGADGTQHNVQVSGVNLSVGPGQVVSAVWAIRPGGRRGPYILFRNHTTGEATFAVTRLWWLATGRWAIPYLFSLWIGGAAFFFGRAFATGAISFFVLPFAYIGLGFLQAKRLRTRTRTLLSNLDRVASGFNPPATAGVPQAAAMPPPIPPPPPKSVPPASWMPDPSGRHEHRYWDGRIWTANVADGGIAATDPL